MSPITITDVKAILTQPGRIPLVVVKIETSEPGLVGLGCATYCMRHRAVQTTLERHLKPFVLGKDPTRIEDLWQSAMVSGYWRNGVVLNNALGGMDMALWDIKGKLAGMPCYELWGGKSRPAAALYGRADGRDIAEVIDNAHKLMEEGYQHIRCQIGCYQGYAGLSCKKPEGTLPGDTFDPREKVLLIPKLFEQMRQALPAEIELIYDLHERLAPINAVWLAKALEPFRMFFLEDLFAPEDIEWFATVRQQSAIPLAMGELFTHPLEIVPLIERRLIDFIRIHPSCYGGVTPCLKLAHMADFYGVRTAWHGPFDMTGVGMAANVHMDVHLHNFGIQEWATRNQAELEMFPGMPEVRQGYAVPNDKPGWGVEFDEALAAKFPASDKPPEWTTARLPDGTIWRP